MLASPKAIVCDTLPNSRVVGPFDFFQFGKLRLWWQHGKEESKEGRHETHEKEKSVAIGRESDRGGDL